MYGRILTIIPSFLRFKNYNTDPKLYTCGMNTRQGDILRYPSNQQRLIFSKTLMNLSSDLNETDKELANLLKQEYVRQKDGVELIASENYTSKAVLDCLGSCLTNKYSEGKVGERYYGGTEVVDKIESLCKKRALEAFELDESEWGVNVQPYSGSPANFAVYTALLKPHDRIMGLYLPDGGHLTHGFQTPRKKISATSIFWESIPYRLDKKTDLIDYDELEKLAVAVRPAIIIAGFSCYSRHLDFARFRKIADMVGAILMADIAHVAGLVASKVYPSPFPYAHIVTTTTHKTLRGPRSGVIFFSKKLGPNKEEFGPKIDGAVFPGLQGGPHNNVIAAVATCFKQVATPEFKAYAEKVLSNSRAMAEYFMVNNCQVVTSGTDNHIILLHVKNSFGINGHHAEDYLNYVNISVNKNACSTDTSFLRPSCIRIGTPAITSRGADEVCVKKICDLIMETLHIAKGIVESFEKGNEKPLPAVIALNLDSFANERIQLDQIRNRVCELMSKYPLAAGLADR